ncbi:DUF3486 family protein [Sphingobium yanoikuyae]|uniref:DUF3486 family protein n=1 Tax=Sphingobium yanoikuyae TaxID=13690 RepID=A0A9X7YDW1_SPHYA|nr:DUF3486 family protein [Sphingobium yanoikuyae]QNG47411.1 DUF3486 family protein [Sphingobium yanoikuyae]
MSDDRTERRQGRGWLSSLDQLPEEADADLAWAIEQLRDRTMPQTAIVGEFNKRLADRGIAGVSKSAFSRWAVRKSIQFRKLDEVRHITSEIVADLGTDGADQVTVAVAEMIKVAIYENLEKGEVDSKSVMEMARALTSVVSAQKASNELRKKLEERAAAQIERAAEKAEKVATEAGLTAERAAQIRRDVLGLRI